ncbi:MAG: 3-isopropylmalate dehydratase large subunit [Candidatus Omnitrophica bacterium]|nr:3-isopropylmalate dehydratase large subunit [Candidatus Omnitrophota bacterium]MCG2704111.1 3-isopropylmalate dehydratase large subunit [Candidatus Omnitrophota bacterium]
MSYTITEKIFNKHVKGEKVKAGDFVYAKVDLALGNDVTAPIAIDQFKKLGAKKVFDRKKIVLVPDHFTPAKDIKSAAQAKLMREFSQEQHIRHYYEVGRMGIEHALLPELGLIEPGKLIIGADSHTCTYGALAAFATGVGSTDLAACWATGYCWFRVPATIKFVYTGKMKKWVCGKDLILYTIGKIGVDGALYKAMEFTGPVIKKLPVEERLTMANMAIEAGGKSGIIEPDEITYEYVREVILRQDVPLRKKTEMSLRACRERWDELKSDKDAVYEARMEINASDIEPQVALPHLPSNTVSVSKLKNMPVDQVVIGSCTNGRISDLRVAAKILKGKKVHPRVRCLIFPATQAIYLQAIKEGLVEIFVNANAVVSTPTCGPCLGGHMGILAKGERAIATTNRNFVGRMGHPESEVYLSSPAVAAASAVTGKITHPDAV